MFPVWNTVTITGIEYDGKTTGQYFNFDTHEFNIVMGPLVDSLRKRVMQKDKNGNEKWCGWVKVWWGPNCGRRDCQSIRCQDAKQWAMGDTIEEIVTCPERDWPDSF